MTHLKKWLYTGRFSKFSSLSPVINQFHKALNVLHVTKRREKRKCTMPSNLTVTPKGSPTSLGLSCWVVWESWDSTTYWFFCYSFNSWDANISTFIGFGIFWYLFSWDPSISNFHSHLWTIMEFGIYYLTFTRTYYHLYHHILWY